MHKWQISERSRGQNSPYEENKMTQRHSRTWEIVQNQCGAKLPLLAKNIILAADTDHWLHRQNVIKIMDQIKVMKPITKTQQIIYISPIDIQIDVEPSGQEDWNIPNHFSNWEDNSMNLIITTQQSQLKDACSPDKLSNNYTITGTRHYINQNSMQSMVRK